ncbi:uncharacterized protein LOC119573836 [Penaeus monodon]|uniref:uncharacterized protein LOC119573836 n=1 Tax=Penaeus monodon TaxID=6687 RepID=UPI0018A75B85|nr:uncharacterized protein LOC119573836 [Penaeus monodon]
MLRYRNFMTIYKKASDKCLFTGAATGAGNSRNRGETGKPPANNSLYESPLLTLTSLGKRSPTWMPSVARKLDQRSVRESCACGPGRARVLLEAAARARRYLWRRRERLRTRGSAVRRRVHAQVGLG